MKRRAQRSSKKEFYMKFNVQDFQTSKRLKDCDAEANGVYIHLLCVLFGCEQKGRLLLKDQYISRFASILLKQNVEQSNKQVFKHIPALCSSFAPYLAKHLPFEKEEIERGMIQLLENDVIFLEGNYLCQSRMIADYEISLARAAAGSKGGRETQKKGKASKQLSPEEQNNLLEVLLKQKTKQNPNYNSISNYKDIDSKGGIGNTEGVQGEENSGGEKEEGVSFADRLVKNSSKNTFVSERTSVKLTDQDFQLLSTRSEEFKVTWQEWVDYLSMEHGKELKSIQAKRAAIEELVRLSNGDDDVAVKIAKKSMSVKWVQFFALKPEDLPGNPQLKKVQKEILDINARIDAETDPVKRQKLVDEKYAVPEPPHVVEHRRKQAALKAQQEQQEAQKR